MLEVVIGTALALAIRDLIYELVDRYQHYKFHKDSRVWRDLYEDIVADDEDID
jgi:hypothetical protein